MFTNRLLTAILFIIPISTYAQVDKDKQISSDLFGIFFEDINYAADGGLYAELIQNRSFEYSPTDKKGWNPFTAWEYITPGFAYGSVSVETNLPLHSNNPHYVVINAEDIGSEGVGLKNTGFDGIVVKAGENYEFSAFIRQISESQISFVVQLQGSKGEVYGEALFSTQTKEWKKYNATITVNKNDDKASFVIIAKSKGKFTIDVVSLFPQNTFKKRQNGLRADLAQTIADLKPKFVRFPGGCLVHGDGLGNMYRWKNTIGPIEQRIEQKNIWGYRQTAGLGYFEFFQFCEDIGAKPLPVLPAAVSCQNSGGTWRIGGTGQKGIPIVEMKEYIQEVLDLIEYANGPSTSTWGAKRAEAGHAQPFYLEYIGIGNEDKITPAFNDRFKLIYDAVKTKYPEIKVIGTVGPAHEGEDYEQGWKIARDLNIPIVDEHYYMNPEWFIANQKRYDVYNRSESKIYLGEYASKGNTLFNAISEAAYMTSLERNGDIVTLASYAPLLAKKGNTQWNPDLIYFDNTTVLPTINYYVQQLFSINQGDTYYANIISFGKDTSLAASCVRDSKSGYVFLKLVNVGKEVKKINLNLSRFTGINNNAVISILTGAADAKNTFENPKNVTTVTSKYKIAKSFVYEAPALSLTVIMLKTNGVKGKK